MSVQAEHQRELNAGCLVIQRCGDCRRHVYFPRVGCPHCGCTALAWVVPAGTGNVHAVTTVRRKPADGGDLNVSIVALDEGVRLMSRVDNRAPADVHIGLRVRTRVHVQNGCGLVLFDALEGGAA